MKGSSRGFVETPHYNLNIWFWREMDSNYGRVGMKTVFSEYYYLQPFALCRHPVAMDLCIVRNVELWWSLHRKVLAAAYCDRGSSGPSPFE